MNAKVLELSLDDLTVADVVQVRVDGLQPEVVDDYAAVYAAGGRLPAVVAFYDERDGRLYLADGFHRVAAASRAGLTTIEVEVRPGGLTAAVEYAEEANLQHGLRLTLRDKRAILERRLLRGHPWAQLSNRELAQLLGVSRGTINIWRREIHETTGKNLPVVPTARVGADGKVRDVRNIQTANRRRTRAAEPKRLLDSLETAAYVLEPPAPGVIGGLDTVTLLRLTTRAMDILSELLDNVLERYDDPAQPLHDAPRDVLEECWIWFLPVMRRLIRAERRTLEHLRQAGSDAAYEINWKAEFQGGSAGPWELI